MAGYVVMDIEVTDEDLHAEFRSRIPALLESRGGKFVVRGKVLEVVGADSAGERRIVVLEFPTIEQAREWPTLHQSVPEFTELREYRDRSANVNTYILEG